MTLTRFIISNVSSSSSSSIPSTQTLWYSLSWSHQVRRHSTQVLIPDLNQEKGDRVGMASVSDCRYLSCVLCDGTPVDYQGIPNLFSILVDGTFNSLSCIHTSISCDGTSDVWDVWYNQDVWCCSALRYLNQTHSFTFLQNRIYTFFRSKARHQKIIHFGFQKNCSKVRWNKPQGIWINGSLNASLRTMGAIDTQSVCCTTGSKCRERIFYLTCLFG